MRIALPLVLLAAACTEPPVSFDDTGDTSAVTDTNDSDTSTDDTCTGTFVLDWSVAQDPLSVPADWEDQGATVRTGGAGGELPHASHDGDGCVFLNPASLRIELLGSGCAGSKVVFEVIDDGPTASTQVATFLEEGKAPTGQNSIVAPDAENVQTLTLQPAEPFLFAQVFGLATHVCGITIDRAPIPERFRPEDTGDPF